MAPRRPMGPFTDEELYASELPQSQAPFVGNDRYTDEYLGVLPAEYDTTEEAPVGGGNVFEGLSGLEDVNAPPSFLTGLIQGVASSGTRSAKRRQSLEVAAEKRRMQREERNLAESRRYRGDRARAAGERAKEERGAAARVAERDAEFKRDNVTITPEIIAAAPVGSPIRRLKPGAVIGKSTYDTALLRDPPKPEGAARSEPLVLIQTADGPRYVKRSDALGQPPPTKTPPPKAPTGAERQTFAFYQRGAGALDDITRPYKNGKGLEQVIANQWVTSQLQGAIAPNFLKSPEQRQYKQAQRAFTEARLRKESGAAISPHEYDNDATLYFWQPGDDLATLRQKQVSRQRVIDGLKRASGAALKEYEEGAPAAETQEDQAIVEAGFDPADLE